MELLVSVLIIGVITDAAIPSISNVNRKSYENFCSSNVDLLVMSARNYMNDYQSLLPKEIGSKYKIPVKH